MTRTTGKRTFGRLAPLSRRAFVGGAAICAGSLFLPQSLRASTAARAAAFDGDVLLVAGLELLRSDDGGSSWTTLTVPAPALALATHPERPGRLVAGLASGKIAYSRDWGRNWEDRSHGLPGGEIDAVTVAAGQPDVLYAAVRGDGLWKSEDAGQRWSLAIDRPWLDEIERDLLALASVDLATGMGGIWIYAGTETGLTRVPDCFCRWQDVQPGNAMDALVSGDAPSSKAPLPPGEPVHALASAPSAPVTLYAALPSGIWASHDAGAVWSRRMIGLASAVAVHPTDSEHIVAVLDGRLKQSRDGGTTWFALTDS